MMSPRWRKILKDLWGNKTRTLMAVLAIAAGVFAVGTISTAYFAISQDINLTYVAIHPAHGVITAASFDESLVELVERLPSVEEAEGRASLGNMSILLESDKKHPLNITAVEDLSALRMDQLRLVSGSWPGKLEMAVVASRFAQSGDSRLVELPDGRVRALRVSGVVEDLNSAVMGTELALSAYVDIKTLDALGLPRDFNQLYFRVPGDAPTQADVQAASRDIEKLFLRNDTSVFQSIVRRPNRHPNDLAAAGLLGILAIIGPLLLTLGGFLVANIISTLLAQQVRQIGIMKAVGARPGQIAAMYMTLATSFGLIALAVAALPAMLLGHAIAQSAASLLSFALRGFRIFPAALLLMVAVGLLVPWLATLLPVLNAMRISTREAIATYGTGTGFGGDLIDRLVERFRGLSRPLLISLRNALRRKGRLALTLSALAAAGAVFMSVFTTRVSIVRSFDILLPLFFSDVNLDFDRAYRAEMIAQIVQQTPGVVYVEAWATTIAELRDAEGQSILERFDIFAPPANSRFIAQPPVYEGRWLQEGDQNALVISGQMALDHPEFEVGDTLPLYVHGRQTPFVIVGKFTWTQGHPTVAYASYAYVAQLLGEAGRAQSYRVRTESQTRSSQDRIGASISNALTQQGYTPTMMTGASARGMVTSGADVIAAAIMFMALLTVAVGSIGLASTMSMNVLERTREIGVMRAIGASNGTIRQMVVVEGMIVGILSWLIGLVLSFPLSRLMCVGVGLALLQRPLDYVFDWMGVAIWLGLVIVISTLASLWPAINAARLTVRDALAYE